MHRTPEHIATELLVLRAQSGDRDAMRALFKAWNPRLRAHASRLLGAHASLDASDATQEAWLAIAKRIRKLSDPALFAPWAHRIVAHKCADASRRAIRERRARESRPATETVHPAPDDRADLRAAFAALTLEHRAVLSMRYGSDLGIGHIALALGIPPGTVKSRLHAARAALKQAINQQEGP